MYVHTCACRGQLGVMVCGVHGLSHAPPILSGLAWGALWGHWEDRGSERLSSGIPFWNLGVRRGRRRAGSLPAVLVLGDTSVCTSGCWKGQGLGCHGVNESRRLCVEINLVARVPILPMPTPCHSLLPTWSLDPFVSSRKQQDLLCPWPSSLGHMIRC